MLTNVRTLKSFWGGGETILPGIYFSSLNFHTAIAYYEEHRDEAYALEYGKSGVNEDGSWYFETRYGVSDNLVQVLSHAEEFLNSPDRYFCISMTPIIREDQSPTGGWRWHKWGEYIGTYESKHEYLYDEDIDKVFVFHIYEVPKDGTDGTEMLTAHDLKERIKSIRYLLGFEPE